MFTVIGASSPAPRAILSVPGVTLPEPGARSSVQRFISTEAALLCLFKKKILFEYNLA
jgi:hypothetical protein